MPSPSYQPAPSSSDMPEELFGLVQNEPPSTVEYHIREYKINVNMKDYVGWTPLMYAVQKGNVAMINMLLHYGANPLIYNNKYKLAYDIARTDDISDLLPRRKQIFSSLSLLEIELFMLVQTGEPSDVKNLIAKNDKIVNTEDYLGWTPLMYAVNQGCADIIKILLYYGANPLICNNHGKLAYNLSFSGDIYKLLPQFNKKH